ncbi:ferric reductase family protein [Lachancea thermotolerans CBS 6340]|uniref:KLTH0A00572p n=1 Tax=Lachancea thermotolerans (strain ATCC 56472 / CBS 6340 / NRRL Y-8284) TaxID=559295 RepID=C5DB88_LACTC|nr:KLTH0A00572p [Lachancea thermotolerans CBS 6340]CAR21045.1 KLTH0A00572p [Lachancea thermotolerans CBS 6340]
MSNALRAVALSFHSRPLPESLQLMITCVSEVNRYAWLWNGDEGGPFYGKACGQYAPSMQTALQCFVTYGAEGSVEEKLAPFTKYCSLFAGSQLTLEDYAAALENGTRFLRDGASVGYGQPLATPIVLPERTMLANLKYFHYIYYNFSAAFSFSLLINLAVAAAVVIAAVAKHSRANDKVTRFVRAKLLVPSIFGTAHHGETRTLPFYRVLLPTRGEAVLLAAFLALNVALACYNYPLVSTGFDTKAMFLLKCVANRTGGLGFGLIPLTVLLAGRNNALQWLTGMPFSSMMFFHKWASRTMALHSLAHALLWFVYGIYGQPEPVASMFYDFAYWRWGIYATLACAALLVHSAHSIKARWYEVFVVLHVTLALLFLVACLKHCAEFGWLGWIYLALGIWGSDRALRLWRLFFRFGGYTHGYAHVISAEDHIYKIVVPHVDFSRFRFFPGCYAFLHVQGRRWFWQSHPFTLMRAGEGLEILLKAKEGLTRDLLRALPRDGAKVPLRLALEGPYGHEAPLQTYRNVLVVSSGAGIPGPMSYLQKLTLAPGHVRRFAFVWAVPTEGLLESMHGSLLAAAEHVRAAAATTCFELRIHVTRPRPGAQRPAWVPAEFVVSYGRPRVHEIVRRFCDAADGPIAVTSCANPALDDLVRRYVSEQIARSAHRVDYYDELQVW